jgi:hypothetical protein
VPSSHAEDTVVYRIFGPDLLATLADPGFSVTILRGARAGLAISSQEVIIATKAPFLDPSTLVFDDFAGNPG